MKIRSIETFRIRLPFRFSFAHNLSSRSESRNLIVKITLDDGTIGFGEGIPRDYVTGEDLDTAEHNVLAAYAPLLCGLDLSEPANIISALSDCFQSLGLNQRAAGASWCATELAVLDATSRAHGLALNSWLGQQKQTRIRYGGVLPFGKKKYLAAILYFYKLYGFKTVKLKVGSDLEEDIEKLRLARKIMGEECLIRVDANCAWTEAQALKANQAFKPFRVASYEQPCPAKEWQTLKNLTEAFSEDIVVDESLCTLQEAADLARDGVCNAFNIRISKVGGFLAAQSMIDIAQKAGLRIHLGAQVGESGILSSAQRIFASMQEPLENYEGSANTFLLNKDLCRENLNAGLGGWGDFQYAGARNGLGLRIPEARLSELTETESKEFQPQSAH